MIDAKQYFTAQLESTPPLTQETVDMMIQNRRNSLTSTEADAEINRLKLESRVGQKMLYYMVETPDGVDSRGIKRINVEIFRTFEPDVEWDLQGLEFVEDYSVVIGSTMPKFRAKK